MQKQVPDEATFSHAFAEFAETKLAAPVPEAPVKIYLGADTLIGHITRDGTAIEAGKKTGKKTGQPFVAIARSGKVLRQVWCR